MSTHITGKLIVAGDYTEEEQIDYGEPLACAVVVMPRSVLRDVATLPMYKDVTAIKTADLAALRAENAALRAVLTKLLDWGPAPPDYWREDAKQRFVLDVQAARAVVAKEAQP